jgi:hypothetical protein
MMRHYRHTQIGRPILIIMGVVTAVLAAVTIVSRDWTLMLLLPVPLLIVIANFCALTVTVTDDALEVSFGIGLIRRRFPLRTIRSFRRVQTPWYAGWGIHFLPSGWVYNIAGSDAVELKRVHATRVRVGTDEPDKLVEVLARVAPHASAPASGDDGASPAFTGLIAIVVVLVTASAGGMIYLSSRPVRVTIADNLLTINGGTYREKVPLTDIRGVSIADTLPPLGTRTNGFALGDTLRGTFTLQRGGSARLYVQRHHPPYLTITTRDHPVIVSYDDPNQTRELYDRLRQSTGLPRDR